MRAEVLSYWATIASAIATIVLAGLSLKQSRQNLQQLQEMVRSRRSTSSPNIIAQVSGNSGESTPVGIFDDHTFLPGLNSPLRLDARKQSSDNRLFFAYIDLVNVGKGDAYQVKVSVDGAYHQMVDHLSIGDRTTCIIQVLHGKEVPHTVEFVVTFVSLSREKHTSCFLMSLEIGDSGVPAVTRIECSGYSIREDDSR
jgi:hypothetical protein